MTRALKDSAIPSRRACRGALSLDPAETGTDSDGPMDHPKKGLTHLWLTSSKRLGLATDGPHGLRGPTRPDGSRHVIAGRPRATVERIPEPCYAFAVGKGLFSERRFDHAGQQQPCCADPPRSWACVAASAERRSLGWSAENQTNPGEFLFINALLDWAPAEPGDIVAKVARATAASRIDRLDSALEPNEPDKPPVRGGGKRHRDSLSKPNGPKERLFFNQLDLREGDFVMAGGAEAQAPR
jgi:hypothetical protein